MKKVFIAGTFDPSAPRRFLPAGHAPPLARLRICGAVGRPSGGFAQDDRKIIV